LRFFPKPVVTHKPFQAVDVYRLIHFFAGAFRLAGMGTHAACHCRKRQGFSQHDNSVIDHPQLEKIHVPSRTHACRTSHGAGGKLFFATWCAIEPDDVLRARIDTHAAAIAQFWINTRD
jgi:hypothetical protein